MHIIHYTLAKTVITSVAAFMLADFNGKSLTIRKNLAWSCFYIDEEANKR